MAKPILIIKAKRINLVLKDRWEELLYTKRRIEETLGNEYHVIIVEENMKVEILNGLSFELTEEEIEELKQKISGALK